MNQKSEYECEECGKSFKEKYNLNRHSRTMHSSPYVKEYQKCHLKSNMKLYGKKDEADQRKKITPKW